LRARATIAKWAARSDIARTCTWGTADYNDRFRPRYPDVLLDDLRAHVDLDGTGRLLDLACGMGHLAFAFAWDVAEIWAVDQEAGSIEFARRKAMHLGATDVRWMLPLPRT
jgi:2-polyprenyl-3-methyl-5-hydroxy-6-metoxy-1,4-benzoquinol methylase